MQIAGAAGAARTPTQRQRIKIAQPLALEPHIVILDEAVCALDKSVEAQVLNRLLDLKKESGLTCL